MSADTTRGFERADDLAGAVVRPAGDGLVVELSHCAGVYSRFAPGAACHVRIHDNGRRAVVIDLAEGDGWFDASGEAVIEVRRSGATIVAGDGAAVAVKGERDGRTIVVAATGVVTVQPSVGERVVLTGQAAMLDPEGRIGQVVDVSAEQVESEPWIARNRALEPLPVEAEPEPQTEPELAAEPEPELGAEPEPAPVAEPEPVAVTLPEPVVAELVEYEPVEEYEELDTGRGRRRLTRLVMVVFLLIGALGLLLPRVGSTGDDDDAEVSSARVRSSTTIAPPLDDDAEPETEPEVTEEASPPAPEASPPAPEATVEDDIARGEVEPRTELVACSRSAGQVSFTGRVTNPDAVEHAYRLHVVYTDASGAAVERRAIELTVGPGATESWESTSSSGSRLQGGSCDLERVEQITP